MSWRETLGVAEKTGDLHTQNTQNSQKSGSKANSADIADSAEANGEEADARLLEALSDACRGLPITPVAVRDALAPEDIEDWRKGDFTKEALAAFARALVQHSAMDRGERPAHYTEQAICQHCGPIWLWTRGEVIGCPWCWNRVADRPIPRPHAVRCQDCTHFQRTDHPHLGRCAKGKPEPVAGLWDTDRRYCQRYLPHREAGNSKNQSVTNP